MLGPSDETMYYFAPPGKRAREMAGRTYRLGPANRQACRLILNASGGATGREDGESTSRRTLLVTSGAFDTGLYVGSGGRENRMAWYASDWGTNLRATSVVIPSLHNEAGLRLAPDLPGRHRLGFLVETQQRAVVQLDG